METATLTILILILLGLAPINNKLEQIVKMLTIITQKELRK